jgi:hypothetical protein
MKNLFMSHAAIAYSRNPAVRTAIGRANAVDCYERDGGGAAVRRALPMQEAASVVGRAIGKPDLAYAEMPSSAFCAALLKAGVPQKTSDLIVEMCDGANAGLMIPQEQRSARNIRPSE